ncbi:hypothetical protein AbraIFM66950_007881 [Aspergillus brasiliensis]|nr:hypothetical protein AbraIFM66950_007881 [Aspergillus brasiliensis]
MSILTVPVAPRARFLQNLIVSILAVGLATALSFLSMWCAVRARDNTTHVSEAKNTGPVTGAPVSPFNAAASVNMAVWLAFEVWLANTFVALYPKHPLAAQPDRWNRFRAFRPQYFLPSIIFSIFVQVTGTYGSQFATLKEAANLIKHLVETFFTGFGLSAAVNMLILPVTSRKLVTIQMTEILQGVQKTLDVQHQFIDSLSSRDWFPLYHGSDFPPREKKAPWLEADAVHTATIHFAEGFAKMKAELRYAKREAGWAYLGPKELVEISHILKKIFTSILWIESIVKVTKSLEGHGSWETFRGVPISHTISEFESNQEEKQQWHRQFEQRRTPARELFQAMKQGISHSLYALRLQKPPARVKLDLESNQSSAAAGLQNAVESFVRQRQAPLEAWLSWTGMDGPEQTELKRGGKSANSQQRERRQFQLFLFLDLEYSLITTARSILELTKYADSKAAGGTMTRQRFIVPSWKQLTKWFWASLSREDHELDYQQYNRRSGTVRVSLRDVLQTGTDPEHLSPRTHWERISDKFRSIFHFFGSPESMFGLRVAVATMSVTLVAFLRNSQHFYIQQRLIWGSIMIAISMTLTAGSAMYGQSVRFIGTVIGMVVSYIDWYIVDAHTAGVLVFVGISMALFHYPLIRFPADPVIPIIGMVTVMLIVGYALQVKKVGLAVSESNGQAYHALYVLSPYRVATVVGGIGVAFIFTYFPCAFTVRTRLRKDLGSFIYLLAHYYSAAYKACSLRLRDIAGYPRDKKSLGTVLEKALARLLAKEVVLLQGMKQHLAFVTWEPALGGKFPRDAYEKLAEKAQSILQLITVMVFITDSFREDSIHSNDRDPPELWRENIKKLITSLDSKSREVTSFFTTTAGVIKSATPLPLYIREPRLHHPSQVLADADGSLLSVQHVGEEGYSAIAALEITIALLADNLAGLHFETKKLVGELDPVRDIIHKRDWPANMDSMMAWEELD